MTKPQRPDQHEQRHVGIFRHSGPDSSRHQPEKSPHHDNMSKSSSDKARGGSTEKE